MRKTNHHFQRQESWRLVRVKEAWRRPKGVTSRMRKEKAGWPIRVKNGFRSEGSTRGLHPRGLVEKRVERLSDLEGLDAERHIIRLSRGLGEKKRLLLLERIRQLHFHIANPGKEEARPAAPEETETGHEKAPVESAVSEEEAAGETGVKDEASPAETAEAGEELGSESPQDGDVVEEDR